MTTTSTVTQSPAQTQPLAPARVQEVRREEKPLPRTIYDASGFEVFAKHFLAGFSQALGMILVYGIFVTITITLAMRYLLPTVQPYLDMYKQSMQSLQAIQSTFGSMGGGVTGTTDTFQEGSSGASAEFSQGSVPGITTMTVTPEQLQYAQQLLQQMQQKPN